MEGPWSSGSSGAGLTQLTQEGPEDQAHGLQSERSRGSNRTPSLSSSSPQKSGGGIIMKDRA